MNRELTEELLEEVRTLRREFHRYPETGWTEMRTTSRIAGILSGLGYEVLTGNDAVCEEGKMGLPSEEEFASHETELKNAGLFSEEVSGFGSGKTGVVAVLKGEKENGNEGDISEHPVLAFRFDMDALPVSESGDPSRVPVREGFASEFPGKMHACGHDGHMAIGLGTAMLLAKEKNRFSGTVKLLFQPAEEGVRGALGMVKSGILDDVDYLSGIHLQPSEDGSVYVTPGMAGTLATTKLDVTFKGKASHAGFYPDKGNNAMLAAATAVLNLQAIPRHGDGESRINVGTLYAGAGRNIICDQAVMQLEVRGETTKINTYMEEYARRIVEAAAVMHGCEVSIVECGKTPAMVISEDFAEKISLWAKENAGLTVRAAADMGGSEDFACMADYVMKRGRKACFSGMHTTVKGDFHSTVFDFDEKVLGAGILLNMAIFRGIFS